MGVSLIYRWVIPKLSMKFQQCPSQANYASVWTLDIELVKTWKKKEFLKIRWKIILESVFGHAFYLKRI